MCEIVLCVKNMDITLAGAPQQGDVIDVQADGFDWGPAVLGQIVPGNPNGNHNFWRLIKLPNVSVAQASTMLAREIPVDPQNPGPNLQFRGFFLDKTKIVNQALLNNLADDLRASPSISVNFTAGQLNSIVTQRPVWGG